MRSSLGVIAAICLALGLFSIGQADVNPFWGGLLVRVGSLLGVIWLAFPQLSQLRRRIPTVLIAVGLLGLLLVAARPNQGRFFLGFLAIALLVTGILKWLARQTGAPPSNR